MAEKQFPLAVVIKGVDRVTAPLRTVSRSISRVGDAARRVSGRFRAMAERGGLPVLQAAAGHVTGSLFQLGKRIAWVGAGLIAMGGAAVAAATKLVSSFAHSGDEIAKQSQRMGVSAEKLQEWRFAADHAGVGSERFDMALLKLNTNIGYAIAGTGQAKDVFKGLGIKLKDASGHARSANEIFPELADKISKLKSASMKTAVASQLMGERAGPALLTLLKYGSKGLAEQGMEARRLGLVMSSEAAHASEDFIDAQADLGYAMLGVKNIIGSALLPKITDLFKTITGWIVANQGRIKAFFDDFAAKLPGRIERLRKLLLELWDGIKPGVEVMKELAARFGAANLILGTIATMIAATVVPAMVSLTGAVYTLGVALLTTPIGWILGGLAALAAAAYTIYRNWEPISRWLGDNLFGPFLRTFPWVVGLTDKLWKGIKAIFTVGIGFVKAMFEGTFDIAGWLYKAVKAAIDIWEKYSPPALIRAGFEDLMGWISNLNLGQAIRDKVASVASYLPSWLQRKLGIDDIAMATPAGAAPVGAAAVATGGAAQNGAVRVQVDFNNMPRGTRVQSETRGRPQVELNQGYAVGYP